MDNGKCISLCLLVIIYLQLSFISGQNDESSSIVIKKCFCEGNQVQTTTGCQDHSPLYVQIWNKNESQVEMIDLSTLSVVLQPLECPSNLTKDNVMESPFISTEGNLIEHSLPETSYYCIENIRLDSGELFQRVEKCMDRFSIRLCCQTSDYMDSSGRCTKIPENTMETVALNWLNKFLYNTSIIECESGELMHDILSYDMPVTLLKNLFINYKEQTKENFCLGMYGDENEIYPGATFCSSSATNMTSMQQPHIPFCCPTDFAFDLNSQTCISHNEQFQFPDNVLWPSQGALRTSSAMNCSHVSLLELNPSASHHLNTNGSLGSESGHAISFEKYCFGSVIQENLTFHSGLTCLFEEDDIPCAWRLKIYKVCLSISSLFLVATLIVYLGIPELRRRIGGVCLIAELFALLVSQITLLVIQVHQREFNADGCLAAGVIEIIFVLASFFWLNIMCYDVWSTFRILRAYSEKIFKTKIFLKYSLYGWGIPLAIGIIAVIMEKLDAGWKPNFSPDTGCFFSDDNLYLHWFYIYGIILFLLIVNLCLFAHLSKTLLSNQLEQKKHFQRAGNATSNQDNQNMENFKLYLKLFVIMGLPWLIEVFTSFASKETLCYIWFLDLFNMLRGVLIFVIFVCKKSTRDLVIATWCPSYKPKEDSSSSRKISTMSLSSWLPSIRGRKISKVSMTSGGNVNLESLREEHQVIKEEDEL